jgi:hypothetical protein
MMVEITEVTIAEDKISIVVDELAEGFDNVSRSERIEECEIDAKEFVIE